MKNLNSVKILIPIFIFAAIFVFPLISFAAQTAALSLNPSNGSFTVGDTFTVNILLNTGANETDGVDIHYLNYNSALLEVQDADSATSGVQIQPGSLYANTVVNTVDAAAGKIDFAQVTTGGATFNGSGVLATATFKVLASGTANLAFDFTLNSTTDTNVATNGSDSLISVGTANYTLAPKDSAAPTISSVSASGITLNSAIITWTTDEPATSQVEYGFTAAYGSATSINSVLTVNHSQTLSGLSAGALYHYRVRSKDAAENEAVSVDKTFTTLPAPDTAAPGEITTLSLLNSAETSLELRWTAVGDDGVTGTAESYEIRRSNVSPGSDAISWWNGATSLSGVPVPQAAGAQETYISVGLSPNTTYYFAVRVKDEVNNISSLSLSSIKSAATLPVSDTSAPIISNISVSNISQNSAAVSWTTNESSTHQVEYGLTSSYGSQTAENSALMTSHSETIAGLNANTLYHYRVKSKDQSVNLAVSADQTFTTLPAPDTTPPGQITDFASSNLTSNSVTFSWTSPGDDGSVGTASSYEIRYATTTITASNFSSATLVNNPPSPQVAGTQQSVAIGSLVPATTYTAAIKTKDEAEKVSAISNIISFTTNSPPSLPDTASPVISNIQATQITATSASISWITNESADSTVKYGFSASSLASTASSSALATSHNFALPGLFRKTVYYYQIFSKDAAGNQSESSILSFKTASGTPPKVRNLQAGKGSIVLSWDYPSEDTFIRKIQILRRTDKYPDDLSVNTSFIIATLTNLPANSFADETASPAVQYYYSVFTVDDESIVSDPASVSFTLPSAPPSSQTSTPTPATPSSSGGGGGGGGGYYTDSTPPNKPDNFKAEPAEKQTFLTWQNPKDGDFARVLIVRKENSAPASRTDGNVIYEGDSQEFTDTNLDNAKTYFYAIYSYDKKPNYSEPVIIQVQPKAGKTSIEIEKKTEEKPPVSEVEHPIIPKAKSSVSKGYFVRHLKLGDKGEDIKKLQEILVKEQCFSYHEFTGYFGQITKQALICFQEKYKDDILKPHNLTEGTGYFGQSTIKKIEELYGETAKLAESTITSATPSAETTKQQIIEQLQNQINQLKQQIIQLLNQLIELLQERLKGSGL